MLWMNSNRKISSLSLSFLLFTSNQLQLLLRLLRYLDNQPYHDSISLNTLSAQLALLLAQPGPTTFQPPPPSSSSSSDDEQDDNGKRRIGNGTNGRDQEGRIGKRVKAVEHSSPGSSLSTSA